MGDEMASTTLGYATTDNINCLSNVSRPRSSSKLFPLVEASNRRSLHAPESPSSRVADGPTHTECPSRLHANCFDSSGHCEDLSKSSRTITLITFRVHHHGQSCHRLASESAGLSCQRPIPGTQSTAALPSGRSSIIVCGSDN